MYNCKYIGIFTLIKLGLIAGLSFLSPVILANPSILPASSILIAERDTDFTGFNSFDAQRQIYQQAEQALKSSHYNKFKRLSQQLKDYPLLPYLQYKNMKRQLGSLTKLQIQDFLSTNEQTLTGETFRRRLIHYYASHQRWNDLIDVYQPQQNISLQCSYLDALIHTGKQVKAFEQTTNLWLSGTSQPKSCDAVFTQWQHAGYQTEDLIWQRINLTMSKGRTQLSQFIAKSLPKEDQRWVDMWVKLHHRPQLANSFKLLTTEHPIASTVRAHAINRLSRKDPQKSIDLWFQLSSHYVFSEQQTQSIYRSIGLSMARQHQPDADIWLQKITPQYQDKYSREWLIRSAIRQANWDQTIKAIEQLSAIDQAELRWQFWWAYAHEQLGNTIDAQGIFSYLATRRSYYGFLAADHLGLPYAFENHPLEFSKMEINSISHYPAALRASELIKLGKTLDARREWYNLTMSLSNRQKLAASKLAQQWQWHDRAIYTMGKTDYRDDVVLRFPSPMKDKVDSWSDKHSIESAWTFAIIRRESAFRSDARSHMGALGLMQIRPLTAKRVARKMHVKYGGKNSLLSADTNIKLGTGYLGQMFKRLDSQYVLATAAYNAGPGRVQSWLPETQPMDAIRWIETIPFAETREYVSNVLAYTTIYQHLLENHYTRLTSRMPPVPARHPQAEMPLIKAIALNKPDQ